MRTALIIAVLTLVGACASTPAPRYYTLDMRSSGAVNPPVNIEIGRITASEQLTRPDILVKPTPWEVEYYATDRWAAALEELVREKLEAEFGPNQASQPCLQLSGRVLAFEQVDSDHGPQAHVKLDLAFHCAGSGVNEEPVMEKVYEVWAEAGEPAPSSVVQTLSTSLETIAAQIAEDCATLVQEGKINEN